MSTCGASSSPAASATDNAGEAQRNFATAGIGYAFGPVNTSLTYGAIFDANSDFEEATGIGDSAYNAGALGRFRPGAGLGARG